MSDFEKIKVNIEEKNNENFDESDYFWSDEEEEGEMCEIVFVFFVLRFSEVD